MIRSCTESPHEKTRKACPASSGTTAWNQLIFAQSLCSETTLHLHCSLLEMTIGGTLGTFQDVPRARQVLGDQECFVVLFFFKNPGHTASSELLHNLQVVTATVFSHLSGPTERMTRSICESVEVPAMYV